MLGHHIHTREAESAATQGDSSPSAQRQRRRIQANQEKASQQLLEDLKN